MLIKKKTIIALAGSVTLAVWACGKDDKKNTDPQPASTPPPKNDDAKPKNEDVTPLRDSRNVDLTKISTPCKENDEDLAKIISVDNVPVVQFCRNRQWGNPYFDASSMRCMDLGFTPVITEDKRGVSCRNSGGTVSLNTQWGPSGRGLEACNPKEYNRWYSAFDRDGVRVALRCTEMGRFDGLQPKTRFKCSDSDLSYKLVFINEGEGVACRRDDKALQTYSFFTAQLGTYLSNANCPKPNEWEYYKSREGRICAGKCDATDDQVPGLFINQNSPGSTVCCSVNEAVLVNGDKSGASCVTP